MSSNPNQCPECDEGICEEIVIEYPGMTQDGETIMVPSIPVWRCNKCGNEWLSPEAADAVDAFIAKTTEQLTPAELNEFLEKHGFSQTEAAEILGLGEKTIHRWLKGRQVVSRSMGQYIRLLQRFPDALEWLRARGWRAPIEQPSEPQKTTDFAWGRFPALDRLRSNLGEHNRPSGKRVINPAKGLQSVSVFQGWLQ